MLDVNLSNDVFSTSWVKVDGVEYRAGLVICTAVEDDLSVFCEISDVLLVENLIYLLANKLFTEIFDNIIMHLKYCEVRKGVLLKCLSLNFISRLTFRVLIVLQMKVCLLYLAL